MISEIRTPEINALACPTSAPNSATPRTLPVCRVEFRRPAASPERAFSTVPSNVEVSGGTRNPKPAPIPMSCVDIAQ
jgi:hypothetical protein